MGLNFYSFLQVRENAKFEFWRASDQRFNELTA
jgi:hypothetical protein